MQPDHARQRQGLVTSHTAAAVTGHSEWMSPRQAKQAITTDASKSPTLDVYVRGHSLERPTAEWAAAQLGLELAEAPFIKHADGWSGDTTDFLLVSPKTGEVAALCEAKTVGLGTLDKWGREMTDDIPTDYLIQCHWHMLHHPGVDVCYVPVLAGGYDFRFRMYAVERCDAFNDALWAAAKTWHQKHIVEDGEPPVTHLDFDTIKAAYPGHRREMLTNPPLELVTLIQERIGLHDIAKAQQQLLQEHNARICEAIGDREGIDGGEGCDWKCTWRADAPRAVTDWQAVAVAAGAEQDLIAKHTITKPGPRKLLIQRVKPKPAKSAKKRSKANAKAEKEVTQ